MKKFNLKEILEVKIMNGENVLNYTDMYNIISKPWVNTEEIKKICLCGNKKAMAIRKEVEKIVKEKGKHLPDASQKIIPTPVLLEYIGMDIEYVYNMALKEKEIGGGNTNEC